MVLFNQPTHFKHSIFKPVREFKADVDEEHDDHKDEYGDEEEHIPAIKESKYLPGERLLKKINKDRAQTKAKKKKLNSKTIDRISKSLSRTVRQLTTDPI
jgi:hypothetical protein